MIVGIKDGVKLVGMIVVSFCAVFVCTFFLNFYVDALAIADAVPSGSQPLSELCQMVLISIAKISVGKTIARPC